MPLCVWTAVHPDIPLIYNFWSSFAERLRLMLLAIMFPEFILTGAWDERRQALSLFNDVQASIGGLASTTKPHPHTPPPSMNERANDDDVLTLLPYSSNTSAPGCRAESGKAQPPWSFEHAIFAVMGGFATETHYIDENNQQRTIRRIVTPEGISILARIGRLPIIDGQEIEERSKADVFAKAAVVGQCLWFACQVIGRLSQDLPVTPLETHTLIHVGCAILIYVVWMRKPYNLSQCVVVRAADIECIGSLFNFHDISRKVLIDELENYEKDRIRYWKQRIVDSSRGVSSQSLPPARPMLKSITELLDEHQIPAPQCTDEKVNILRAIAADASKGLQILRSQASTLLSYIETLPPLLEYSVEYPDASTNSDHNPEVTDFINKATAAIEVFNRVSHEEPEVFHNEAIQSCLQEKPTSDSVGPLSEVLSAVAGLTGFSGGRHNRRQGSPLDVLDSVPIVGPLVHGIVSTVTGLVGLSL
ncbi:hypothetical protein BJY04DRAFT_216964 [Aspergillus karnatakaensis]|uniref:uncharacterized protein n=1 Tax=Aspergillus karnatakaensis TaxID=1810916 RepID=UPI003CCD035B